MVAEEGYREKVGRRATKVGGNATKVGRRATAAASAAGNSAIAATTMKAIAAVKAIAAGAFVIRSEPRDARRRGARVIASCSTPIRTGTERTKNSSANHYTMEQTNRHSPRTTVQNYKVILNFQGLGANYYVSPAKFSP